MGSFTNEWENKGLDHVLGNTPITKPTGLWVALFTGDPGDAASYAAEVADPASNGVAYARLSLGAPADATWRLTSRTIDNAAAGGLVFAQASGGAWGLVTNFAICDHATNQVAANMVAHGAFTASKQINDGDQARVAQYEMDISFNSGGFGTYCAAAMLDHIFRTSSFSQPTLYMALSTVSPGDDNSGLAEPSGNNYAREAVATWDAAASGATANTAAITFNEASGSWGTIADWGLYDASGVGTGNLLIYAAMDADRAVGANDTPRFNAGECDITLD